MFGVLALCAGPSSAEFVDRVPPKQAELCVNCHNQTPEQQASADAQVIPLLGAQQPRYLENALLAYARRQRDHFFMRGVAAGLSADERAEVIRYFAAAPAASLRPATTLPMPASAAPCVACHGDSSRQPAAEDIPRLAGQHQPYLQAAFLGYVNGARRHGVMQRMARDPQGQPVLPGQELDRVLRWFSALPDGVSGR